MRENDSVAFIVLAAGSGRRMGVDVNKAFLPIAGIPLLYRTLKRADLHPMIGEIFLVLREADRGICLKMMDAHGELSKLSAIISGGKERADSVRNALEYVVRNSEKKAVMIHDGARPFFTDKIIKDLIESTVVDSIVVPGGSVTDTIRRKSGDNRTNIVDRQDLYMIQTPQACCSENIRSCFLDPNLEDFKPTDDASYFERRGLTVTIIEGDKRNIKITTQEDLKWAECLLKCYPSLTLPGECS